MFIGHFGVAFGAKPASPRVSLGTVFMAVQFVDLLWPTFLVLGLERVAIDPGNTVVTPLNFISYPLSHSLLMVLVWGLLFGAVHWLRRRDMRSAVVLGLCVLSHWVLDLLTHRPDLPLYPGSSTFVGLGLWNSLAGTLVVECALFAGGIFLYLRATKASNRVGSIGLWTLIGFLVISYATNLFGPPPPSVEAIKWAGHLQWLMVAWAYWVDRNRVAVR